MTNINEIEKAFVEAGADLEHQRWARWQSYFYLNDTSENRDRWNRQIKTPYSKLSEQEKESDRQETRNYLPLLRQAITSLVEELEGEVRDLPDVFPEMESDDYDAGAAKTKADFLFLLQSYKLK